VANLGRIDGFLGNPQVKIPLPESAQRGERAMRRLGMGMQRSNREAVAGAGD